MKTKMLHGAVLVALLGIVTAVFDEELHAKYLTMPRPDFIEYFNKQNYSWKITQHDNLDLSKYLSPTQFSKTKTFPLRTRHELEVLKDLPENFDSREKWSYCESIKDIYHQGTCFSCWAFATAMTASDRTCIHKNVHVRLSEQDFECLQYDVCKGGDGRLALQFWQEHGLVTLDCKPYDVKKLKENKCLLTCVNENRNYTQDKHFAGDIYSIPNDDDTIKTELFINGPIHTGFAVFSDFSDYHHGVYEHSYGKLKGYHSVRVIGYGVENGKAYWMVANSWGDSWGDHGWVKIKRYQKELQFEDYLLSGLPKL